jgi:hypothetical protein
VDHGYARHEPTAEPISYKRTVYALYHIIDPGFDLRKTMLVDKQHFTTQSLTRWNAPDPETFHGTANLEWGSVPERFAVRTNSNQPGWTYITSTWYPGWTARLDGRPVEIVRANSGFSAVAVPAGNHRIDFAFRYRHFAVAAALSAITWLLGIAALLLLALRRQCVPPSPPFSGIAPTCCK